MAYGQCLRLLGMRKACAICNRYVANYSDTHDDIAMPVCRRCFRINRIERKYNEGLRAIVPYLRKKEYAKAKKEFGLALKRMSKDEPLYVTQWLDREHMDWLSHFFYMNGDYQSAIALLQKRLARKHASNYSELTSNLLLAEAYYRYGDKTKAKRVFERVLYLGIREKEPSALSALEKLKEYYGKNLGPKPLYLQAIGKLCSLQKLRVPTKCKNIVDSKALAECIDWVSSVKKRWY